MNMSNLGDQKRMRFVLERDGPVEAVFFARQCVRQYRKSVLAMKRKHGKRGAFRDLYIQSYLFHKEWLYNCADFIEEREEQNERA